MSDAAFVKERLDVADIGRLQDLHAVMRFRLSTFTWSAKGPGTPIGTAHMNGDQERLVDELLRLARLGALSEAGPP